MKLAKDVCEYTACERGLPPGRLFCAAHWRRLAPPVQQGIGRAVLDEDPLLLAKMLLLAVGLLLESDDRGGGPTDAPTEPLA